MRTIVTIEARMGSTRLPKKMTKEICGIPVLELVIRRLQRVRNADDVVVATTDNPNDDALEAICKRTECHYFRGSEQDVTQRLLDAAAHFKADVIAQTWGDGVLQDPAVIDKAIEIYRNSSVDFVSNRLIKSFPAGLEVQVFSFATLQRVVEATKDPSYREHGTNYIFTHPREFTMKSFSAEGFFCPEKRWLLDYAEDLDFLRAVYERLYPDNPRFSTKDVLDLLKREPALNAINSMHSIDTSKIEHYEVLP